MQRRLVNRGVFLLNCECFLPPRCDAGGFFIFIIGSFFLKTIAFSVSLLAIIQSTHHVGATC
jgi:hypothetical protein